MQRIEPIRALLLPTIVKKGAVVQFTIDVKVETFREKEAIIHGAGHIKDFPTDGLSNVKAGKVCNLYAPSSGEAIF